jgi:hypothetical protein
MSFDISYLYTKWFKTVVLRSNPGISTILPKLILSDAKCLSCSSLQVTRIRLIFVLIAGCATGRDANDKKWKPMTSDCGRWPSKWVTVPWQDPVVTGGTGLEKICAGRAITC